MINLCFICDDCGRVAAPIKMHHGVDYQDGCGNTLEYSFGHVGLPDGWENKGTDERCAACAVAWSEKMRPVWKQKNEEYEKNSIEKFKKLFNENREEFFKVLKEAGNYSSELHNMVKAIQSCLEEKL